jgi:hypothetical protein
MYKLAVFVDDIKLKFFIKIFDALVSFILIEVEAIVG